MVYYKFLNVDNAGPFSDYDYTPYLPTITGSGPWLPTLEGGQNILVPCRNGYHACTAKNLSIWASARLYEVELGIDRREDSHKALSTTLRFVRHIAAWDEQAARLFAADCAERVFPIVQRVLPQWDDRARRIIRVARAVARDEVEAVYLYQYRNLGRILAGDVQEAVQNDTTVMDKDGDELSNPPVYAAESLAWSVDDSPFDAAAWSAACAALAVADNARRSSPERPAHDIWDVANDAERVWQSDRILHYIRGDGKSGQG